MDSLDLQETLWWGLQELWGFQDLRAFKDPRAFQDPTGPPGRQDPRGPPGAQGRLVQEETQGPQEQTGPSDRRRTVPQEEQDLQDLKASRGPWVPAAAAERRATPGPQGPLVRDLQDLKGRLAPQGFQVSLDCRGP